MILSLDRVSMGERGNMRRHGELHLREHGLFWGQAKDKTTSEREMAERSGETFTFCSKIWLQLLFKCPQHPSQQRRTCFWEVKAEYVKLGFLSVTLINSAS